MTVTLGTTCSGIGGAELAATLSGRDFRTRFAVEQADHPFAVLAHRTRVEVLERDVYQTGRANLPPVDVYAAGFPCQPFSMAGRRDGERDPRNLWPEIARHLEELQPPVAILENVPGLRVPHDDVLPYLGTVLGDLVEIGYHAHVDGIAASSVGAPHRRDRLWIVAWRPDAVADFDPFRAAGDVLADARGIGSWSGERWERRDLFGVEVVDEWPRAVIVRGREAWAVPTASPVPPMRLWPTPLVGDATGGRASKGKDRPDEGGLRSEAEKALGAAWATPTATQAGGEPEAFLDRKRRAAEQGHHIGISITDLTLQLKAALGPTWKSPAADDNRDRGGDVPSTHRRIEIGKQINLGMEVGLAMRERKGLLHPTWVEAIMGYPPGWTSLEATLLASPEEVWRAWGPDALTVGAVEGANPAYSHYWLWHPVLGPLQSPLAPRVADTKARLVALGNAWVPQVAAGIMARVADVLEAR